jgi:hypothetical protein
MASGSFSLRADVVAFRRRRLVQLNKEGPKFLANPSENGPNSSRRLERASPNESPESLSAFNTVRFPTDLHRTQRSKSSSSPHDRRNGGLSRRDGRSRG